MKISEVVKHHSDFISRNYPNVCYESILSDDVYGISLDVRTDDRSTSYLVNTIDCDSLENLALYFDKKEAEYTYNLLIKYAKIRNDKAVKK